MRDFGVDSAVSAKDGRYRATLAEGWEIWGPQGGYVAAVALRAAGAATPFPRPATFACHFVRPSHAGPVEIRVESLRRTRRAESLRVTLLQGDEPALEALVWAVDELAGIDHDAAPSPDAPSPDTLPGWESMWPGGELPFPFWANVDVRAVAPGASAWDSAGEPRLLGWSRFHVRPPLEDPFVDAGRMLVAVDSLMYPAATLAHEEAFPYLAPSMDLVVSFHATGADSEWLLLEAAAPLSHGGLVAGRASIWSADGRLLASAMQQMLQRT